jgi:dTDP-4-dehydrorhamnose reductase
MRLLVTGAAGMLGTDVVAAAAGHEVIALARAELDVTDAAAVDAAVADARPDAIVHCAAWTDVDGAEASEEAATAVNGAGAGHVAAAAAQAGAHVVHVSSDYVFDGRANEPYTEESVTGPLSAYGRSKLAGEDAVAREAPEHHTIVRSSWMFGAHGPCFPATIRRLADERDELDVVDDQIGTPTFTGHLAQALVELGTRTTPPAGIVHLAGAGSCSWYEFAREIVAGAGLACTVRPCATSQMPRPARRPAYSVLASERGDELPSLPGWRRGLAEYMAAIEAVSAA